ncbi:hypothetical protein BKK81_31465 [Cupriavidus sp. USMAHM13]|uniref:hypothetical protein n=1 Tax=Cupriavidus sp. USMAHM13 TaxID=1389192 RepID=UPI0008A6D023|nr:hypothetical protein [Cupriavidus sp. USMAHM13]AOZ03563.1 hypothetical protein BKK81_31465 [Cupriavidus sp. USMAHM13]
MSTNKTFTKTLITAAVLAAAVLGGQAYASGPKDSGISGDRYGYVFRGNDARSVYTDGAKAGKADPYTDGAKVGKFDPYTDGARIVAGLDRSGVSSEPARKADPYTDGAKVGKFDPYTDGALA